jgi:O-antigen biosynthesis protein
VNVEQVVDGLRGYRRKSKRFDRLVATVLANEVTARVVLAIVSKAISFSRRRRSVGPGEEGTGPIPYGAGIAQRLERLTPARVENAYDRLTSYRFAQLYVGGKSVVDISWEGVGYGTRLLAETAESVEGLTNSPEGLELASTIHPTPNAGCRKAGLPELPYPESYFDVAVAFEVIEKLERPQELVAEVKRILKRDGIFIVSTPDKQASSNRRNYRDSAHKREMYVPEFRELLERHFERVRLYRQGAVAGGLIYETLNGLSTASVETARFSSDPSFSAEPPDTRFVVAVCSDYEVPGQGNERPYLLLDHDRRVFDEFEEYHEEVLDVIGVRGTEVASIGVQPGRHEGKGRNLETQIQNLRAQNEELKDRLRAIESSRIWWLLGGYRRLRARVATRRKLTGAEHTCRSRIAEQYPAWVRNNRLRASDLRRLRGEAAGFGYKPLVSILLPIYNPEQEWLERALDSVMSQAYPHWDLCVYDDGSTKKHVREVLSRYERIDGRIKVRYSEENTGISGASNAALSLATGEFVGLLDHDDELTPDALFEVVKLLQEHPDADLIYSDEDKVDEAGSRFDPHFKPDWSPDLLLSCNYISHLGVYRRSILGEIGGFRKGFEGSQDHDLALRFTERTDKVHHVPKVLYHWRAVTGSTAASSGGKSYTHERGRRAIAEALQRRGMEGTVEDGFAPNRFRAKLKIQGKPKVSIIIPTRDNASLLRRCIESIERLTTYRNYKILIVDNDSVDPDTVEYLASTPHRVIRFKEEFNYSRINNFAVSHAEGEYILLLNDDTEVISGEWMEAMLQHAQRPEVGAVGAKLLYPDGRIQHAGVITGVGNPWGPSVAAPSHHHYPRGSPGHMGTVEMTRNYSAVTAACMMLRRAVFEEVGGLDEGNLGVAFNDVDLCLRLRGRGYLILYTPYAELYHHESASRGFGLNPAEVRYMRERWGEVLDNDPYYNPNLSRDHADFNLRADMLRPKILRQDFKAYTKVPGQFLGLSPF